MLGGIGAGLQLGWRRLLVSRHSGSAAPAAAPIFGPAEAEVLDGRRLSNEAAAVSCKGQSRATVGARAPRSSEGEIRTRQKGGMNRLSVLVAGVGWSRRFIGGGVGRGSLVCGICRRSACS